MWLQEVEANCWYMCGGAAGCLSMVVDHCPHYLTIQCLWGQFTLYGRAAIAVISMATFTHLLAAPVKHSWKMATAERWSYAAMMWKWLCLMWPSYRGDVHLVLVWLYVLWVGSLKAALFETLSVVSFLCWVPLGFSLHLLTQHLFISFYFFFFFAVVF